MSSPSKAALWLAALGLFVYAAYSATLWGTRPAPGTQAPAASAAAGEGTEMPGAVAAEAETQGEGQPVVVPPDAEPLPKPAREFGVLPPYQARKTSPGEEFFNQGNFEQAIAFWTGMAKQGDRESHYRLGVEYFHGTSGAVARDLTKAREHHLAAAKLGEPRSMFDLGTMYEEGLGVVQDISEAGRWYKRAADYGHAQGQYNFATMLEDGQGAPKDEVQALVYYRLAAAQGFYGVPYDKAKQRPDTSQPVPLDLLERRLTGAQKAEGEKRLKEVRTLTGPLDL
jgi:TPR repeat protein